MSDSASVFCPNSAAAEVAQLGSTVLRSAWPRDQLAILRSAIARLDAIHAEAVTSGTAEQLVRMYHTHGAGTFNMLLAGGLLDDSFLPTLFKGSAYERLCQAYYDDDEFWMQPVRCAFRIHDPLKSNRSFIPFHQDSGSQYEWLRLVMNCWIPLDSGAGRDAPGLEVVRTPSTPGYPLKEIALTENAVYDRITIDPLRVEAEFGAERLAPEFEVGDGFAFSQDVIHRTYVTPQMTQPRMNFEFRVFSPKGLVPGVSIDQVRHHCVRLTWG